MLLAFDEGFGGWQGFFSSLFLGGEAMVRHELIATENG